MAALGVIALMLRDVSPAAVAIAVLAGSASILTPVPAARAARRPATHLAFALVAGVGTFALVAWLSPARAGPLGAARWAPATASVALASILAAVSEEALFRRLVHGLLLPLGASVAVGGSALLFALVHVPAYGWATVPLNLAAGLVLGWQRCGEYGTRRWWGRWA